MGTKENLFGISIAHFCDHLERFLDRLTMGERNASSCLDSIMASGKELVQSLLSILLFTMGSIVKKGNALPMFTARTLLNHYESFSDQNNTSYDQNIDNDSTTSQTPKISDNTQ